MSQTIPVGVSGALILGVPLDDWVVVGTILLLVGNLYFMVERLYKRYRQK